MNIINLFRFNDKNYNFITNNYKIRLFSKTIKNIMNIDIVPIIIENGIFYDIDGSVSTITNDIKYMVVYEKDIDLIFNSVSLEKYCKIKIDIKLDFNQQKELLIWLVSNFKVNMFKSLFSEYNSFFQRKTERFFRFKSSLDSNFFYSNKNGYSYLGTFFEERVNQKIYILDVNSMYPYSMTFNNFTDPKKIKYIKGNVIADILAKKINNGLFKSVLYPKSNSSNFIKKYSNFIYTKNNFSIPIDVNDNIINTLMHANEIQYYSRFFNIEIIDGIYSEKSISHPLHSQVKHFYDLKCNESCPIKKMAYKNILMSLYSNSSIIKYKKHKNNTYKDFINNNFGLNYFIGRYIKKINNRHFNGVDIYDPNNIFSLSSQIVANANIYLLSLYEKIYKADRSFELAYANIDSLHISLPANKEDKFLSLLNKDNIVGPNLGQMKIEGIGSIGLWLDIGKYWILDKVEHNPMEPVRNFVWSCFGTPWKYSVLIKDINNNNNNSKRISLVKSAGININHPYYIKNNRDGVSYKINIFKTLSYKYDIVFSNKKLIRFKKFNYSDPQQTVNQNIFKNLIIIKNFYHFFVKKYF